jgi:regulator of protease activity HflC (stomatin/prohibitin superfamily)
MKIRLIVFAVALFVVAAAFFGSFYTVDEGERGVILYNGRVAGVAEPGLHYKVPVIQDVVDISVRQQNYRFENVAAYSQDQQIGTLVLSVNIQPATAEVGRIYSEFGSLEAMVNRVLGPRVNEEVKTIFGGYTAASAIRDRGKLNADIEAAIGKSVEGAPFQLVSFQLENIDWSDSYEQAVEARATAEAGVATQRQTLEKEKVSAQIAVTQAQATADAALAQAKAKAEATRLQGEAEAAAIEARGRALRDNPAVVELTKAERWDGKLPLSMVPNGTVPFMSVSTPQ